MKDKKDPILEALYQKYPESRYNKKEDMQISPPPVPQKIYDFHGFFVEEVKNRLPNIIIESTSYNITFVRIITGKGEGKLFTTVRNFLKQQHIRFQAHQESYFDVFL